jgi:hypothetical protein
MHQHSLNSPHPQHSLNILKLSSIPKVNYSSKMFIVTAINFKAAIVVERAWPV